MDLTCPICKIGYSSLGKGREPRVLPCGDSCCSSCLMAFTQSSPSFMCQLCGTNIDSQECFPLNKLYYEMQLSLNKYVRKKEYESPSLSKGGDDELSRQHVRYDQKCLNPFCMRPRYQSEELNEMFCSRDCKNWHQQLYVD